MLATPGNVFAPLWVFLYQVSSQAFKAVFPPSAWGWGAKSNTKKSNKIPKLPSPWKVGRGKTGKKGKGKEKDRKSKIAAVK